MEAVVALNDSRCLLRWLVKLELNMDINDVDAEQMMHSRRLGKIFFVIYRPSSRCHVMFTVLVLLSDPCAQATICVNPNKQW